MTPDLDPRLEAAAQRRLTRLYDVVEVGPAPSLHDILAPRFAERMPADATPVVDLDTVRSAPSGSGRRRPLATIIAAAAALIAVALLVRELGVSDGDNAPADEDQTFPDRPTRLMVGELPARIDGLDGTGNLLPLTDEEAGPGSATTTVFGDTSTDDPFAQIDLAVIAVRDETIGLAGEPTTVGLDEAMKGDDVSSNDVGIVAFPGEVRWVTWHETADVELTIASRTLEMHVLEEIAPLVDLDSDDRPQIVGLPDGGTPDLAEEIGVLEDVPFGGSPYISRSAEGYWDTYTATATAPVGETVPEGISPFFALVSAENVGGDDLAAARWLVGGQQIEIRGTQGWINFGPVSGGDTLVTVVWQESPGQINVAAGSDIEMSQMLQLVQDLRTDG